MQCYILLSEQNMLYGNRSCVCVTDVVYDFKQRNRNNTNALSYNTNAERHLNAKTLEHNIMMLLAFQE